MRRLIRLLSIVLCLLALPAALWAQEANSAQPLPPNLTIHVVQRGENLYRIALQYGLTWGELAELNGITNSDSLLVGQRLLVPTIPTPEGDPQTHTVQPGETLGRIAALYGADVTTLMRLNSIANPNTIYAGQVLVIIPEQPDVSPTPTPTQQPGSSPTPAISSTAEAPQSESTPDLIVFELPTEEPDATQVAANLSQANLHIVASGQTMYSIAQLYGLSVQDIATANGLSDPTRIFVGQRLIIPTSASEDVAAAVDLPAPITGLTLRPLIFIEGETGSIRVATSVPVQISGTFVDQTLRFVQVEDTLYAAMVGIPVFTEPDIHPVSLTLTSDAGITTYAFNVRVADGGYFTQNLTISGDLALLLDPNVEGYEWDLLASTTARQTPQRYYDGPLSLPAAAAMNSPFGSRRSYNSGPVDRYHSGADFASAIGAPIFAAAPGRVVLSDRLNIRGNAIVIDHGWGVFTTYSHLTQRLVSPGDEVQTGQTIGTAGATGRITGPHLHWEVWVNGVPINPMQWVREAFP